MSLLNTHAMGRALATRLLFLLALVLSAVVMGTLGYHLLEGWSLFDSLYMTVITLATIGYGETHPLDTVGRIFTVVLIIFGTGVMGYGISSLTLMLFQGDLPHYLRVRKMDKLISRLENHIIICGLSRTGLYALEELTRSGHDVVIIEKSEAQIQQWLGGKERPYIVGDATEDDNLLAAGIERAQAIITSLTSDADNAFVVVTARSLNSRLSIVSKAETESARKKLLAVGADQVVIPSYLGGMNMANLVIKPETLHFFERLHTRYPNTFRAQVVPVEPLWLGRSIAECMPVTDGSVIVVALEMPGGEVAFNPPAETLLGEGQSLMIIGRKAVHAPAPADAAQA